MKLADPKSKSVHLGGTGDRGPGPGSSYSMDKPFLIVLFLSNSPPLTSGLQPSGRGQQPQVGQQPIREVHRLTTVQIWADRMRSLTFGSEPGCVASEPKESAQRTARRTAR